MEVKKIIIKNATKNKGCKYINILSNENNTLYSFYDGISDVAKKSSFNKYSFIEYLKGIQIPKKYIKML